MQSISVVSAGVLSLAAFDDLPEAQRGEMMGSDQSLILASPCLLAECIDSAAQWLLDPLLGFPCMTQILDRIAPLVEDLMQEARPVLVLLEEQDQLVSSRRIARAIQQRFPAAEVRLVSRQHGHPPQ
jgi:hypothetical protein